MFVTKHLDKMAYQGLLVLQGKLCLCISVTESWKHYGYFGTSCCIIPVLREIYILYAITYGLPHL